MIKGIAIAVLATTLIGCASTKSTVSRNHNLSPGNKVSLTIKEPSGNQIPAEQQAFLVNQIMDGLIQNDMLAPSPDSAQYSAIVDIHAFRMRSDAARLTVGMMAGCDNINSTVSIKDNSSGARVGSANVAIKECAAWGVANQVIKKYADGVVSFIAGKQRK